jgi:hypothetical protein
LGTTRLNKEVALDSVDSVFELKNVSDFIKWRNSLNSEYSRKKGSDNDIIDDLEYKIHYEERDIKVSKMISPYGLSCFRREKMQIDNMILEKESRYALKLLKKSGSCNQRKEKIE